MQVPDFAANVARVRELIASACDDAGRKPADVTLVAASKYGNADAVAALYACGLRDFGENRVEAALEKINALNEYAGIRWHFIGHLQRNKARKILPSLVYLHSMESPELLTLTEKTLAAAGRMLDILLEVNIGGEESKNGLAPENVLPFAETVSRCPHLRLQGLMGMAPLATDNCTARPFFRRLRELRDKVQDSLKLPLPQLSMGMSHDFPAAIAEGATMVRVGSALFNL